MRVSFQGGDLLLVVIALLLFYVIFTIDYSVFKSSDTRSYGDVAGGDKSQHSLYATPLKSEDTSFTQNQCTAEKLIRPNGTGECR